MSEADNIVINGVIIPDPSDEDQVWAKKISGKKTGTVNQELESAVLNDQIWRVYFLTHHLQHKEGRWIKRGVDKDGLCQAYSEAIFHSKIDAIKVLSNKSTAFYKKRMCETIQSNRIKVMTFLIKELGYKSATTIEDQCGSSLLSAVKSKNLDMVKLITDNGANLVKVGNQAVELAQELQLPEIARYIKSKTLQLYVDCDLSDEDKLKAIAPNKVKQAQKKAGNDNHKGWKKLGAEIIAKETKLNANGDTLTQVFDFHLQQLTSVFKDAAGRTSDMNVQNFTSLDGQEALQNIRKLLIKLKGTPGVYQVNANKPKQSIPLPGFKSKGS